MSEEGDPPGSSDNPVARRDSELAPETDQISLTYRREMLAGPLPAPEVLKDYGEVVPGLEKKLVAWVEKETAHRQEMERRAFAEEVRFRRLGQYAGAATAILGLSLSALIGVYAALNASFAAASVGIVMAIVSVGGPFAARILAARYNRRQEREDRDE